jgi:Condensation domain/Phosphopantetheine attachment site
VPRLREFLDRDRTTPFDLDKPPLMRVGLLRMGPQQWHFVWATHHLTLDGWSWPLLLAEWSRAYAALQMGEPGHERPALPFRSYVEHVCCPREDALVFWRSQVAQLRTPTPLGDGRPRPAAAVAEIEMLLEPALTAELQALARRLRLTPGTLFNAAWAVALAHACGRSTVAFGMTVSGRPAELDGVESLIGPCVNNVPLCVDVDRDATVTEWLAALHTRQRQIAQHQTTPLELIQPMSAVPWRQRMFDSLVVFQNYRVDEEARGFGAQVRSTLLAAPESTNYPLTLAVTVGEGWRIRWLFSTGLLSEADVGRHADALQAALQVLVQRMPGTVGAWLDALPPHTRAWTRATEAVARPGTLSLQGRSRREQDIAALWCELFGAPQVDLDDNFFDIGGHSLLLVQAHRLMQERWGIELPVVALLRHPTVRSLARHLDGTTQAPAHSVAQTALARVQRLRAAQKRPRMPLAPPGGTS